VPACRGGAEAGGEVTRLCVRSTGWAGGAGAREM